MATDALFQILLYYATNWWFVDDMAPAHLRRVVRQVLDSHYIDRSMW